MSALPVSPTTGTPHFAFVQSAPILGSFHVPVVPGGQPCTHVHPTVTPTQEPPTLYPPPQVETKTQRFYTWHREESVQALAQNDHPSWLYSLHLPIPSDLINPTLTSLVYAIKYGTTHDNGNSTVQTDVVLTSLPSDRSGHDGTIMFDPADLGIYREGLAYGPRMVDDDLALRLSMVPAIKCNGGSSQLSHYIDHRHLTPNVRITQPSHLYLNFHVVEYPTAQTSRSLAIEVSASWDEDLEARKAKEEAERKAKEEAERQAREEAERRAREEAERAAPPVADAKTQQAIQNIADQYGQACGGGFAWKKTATGYACEGGGHSLTFAQLGMIG
jgi:hypothetical protein